MTMFGVRPRMEGSKFAPRPAIIQIKRREMQAIAAEKAQLDAEQLDRARRAKFHRMEMARLLYREAIANNVPPENVVYRVTLRDILIGVCLVHGLSAEEVLADRRARRIVAARQEFMWLAKRYTPFSYPRIGKFLGGRDHTTVLHGARRHQARIDALRAKRRGG